MLVTETSRYADVLLPGVSFAEKTGSFTSTERRIQMVRQAITPRGEARPDWQIIADLARRIQANGGTLAPTACTLTIESTHMPPGITATPPRS
jgi:predicted molibdopterin-dependent oxidoreductase YjgC